MSYYLRGDDSPTFGRDGNSGRVGKKDFSIDGKSWSYRDPRNQRMIDSFNNTREKGHIKYNPKSNPKYDALYDYDFGTVRDAAKVLGINNVNKKRKSNRSLTTSKGALKRTQRKRNQHSRASPSLSPLSRTILTTRF